MTALVIERIATLALVLGAGAYLARRSWLALSAALRRERSSGCGPSCGCGEGE